MKLRIPEQPRTNSRREISIYLDSALPQQALFEKAGDVFGDTGYRVRYVTMYRGSEDRPQWQMRFARVDGLPLTSLDVYMITERVCLHFDMAAFAESTSSDGELGVDRPPMVDMGHLRRRSGGSSSPGCKFRRKRGAAGRRPAPRPPGPRAESLRSGRL